MNLPQLTAPSPGRGRLRWGLAWTFVAIAWGPGWFAWGAAPTGGSAGSFGFSIEGDPHSPQVVQVRRLAVGAEQEIRRLLGSGSGRYKVTFRTEGIGIRRHDQVIEGRVTNPEDETVSLATVVRTLLFRRYLELKPPTPVAPDDLPEWLVAGLAHRVRDHAEALLPNTVFVSCQIMARRNQLPKLANLLDQPLTPPCGLLYRLYGESCAAVLKITALRDAATLGRLLQNVQHARAPSAEFLAAWGDRATARDVQFWYEDQLRKVIYRFDRPLSYEDTRQALHQDVDQVSVPVPGQPVKQVPLEEVEREVDNLTRHERLVDKLLERLFNLQQQAPLVLRPALDRYAGALELLKRGQVEAFRKAIREARAQFEADYARGLQVRDWLGSLEQGEYSAVHRLVPYFDTAVPVAPLTDFEQRVAAYLDALQARGTAP